jgi:hypothetical protein
MALALLLALSAGCGLVRTSATLNGNAHVQPNRIGIAKITDTTTGVPNDINPSGLLREALEKRLDEEKRLIPTTEGNKLVLEATISDYKAGNAAKRLFLPWGTTELEVKGSLKDMDGNIVGSVDAYRTVSIGGVFSVGAWKTIFADVADDIVEEIKREYFERGTIRYSAFRGPKGF